MDLVCGFQTILPHVVRLIESGIPVEGGMTLGEGADADRLEIRGLQLSREARDLQARPELSAGALNARFGVAAAVINDPVVDTELACQQRAAAGQAGHVRCVNIFKQRGLLRQGVDIRTGRTLISVATKMIGSQGIYIQVENSQGRFRFSGSGAGFHDRSGYATVL